MNGSLANWPFLISFGWVPTSLQECIDYFCNWEIIPFVKITRKCKFSYERATHFVEIIWDS